MDVELRHLRSFVAVAEELNFTRAAERLHLAQPALSAQIRQLEQRVGARLFERTTRRVELTPAGSSAARARRRRCSTVWTTALRAARMAAAGETGALTVGLLATAALDVTPRILRAFARERPKVAVSVRNVDFADPSGGVRDRGRRPRDGVAALPRRRARLRPAVRRPPRWRCSPPTIRSPRTSSSRSAELLAEPMCWVEGVDPVAGAFWTLDEQRGAPPAVGATVTGFEDMFAAVRAGAAIAAIPASIATGLPFADIASRPVNGLPGATVAICRRAGSDDPLVEAFAACAREVCASD